MASPKAWLPRSSRSTRPRAFPEFMPWEMYRLMMCRAQLVYVVLLPQECIGLCQRHALIDQPGSQQLRLSACSSDLLAAGAGTGLAVHGASQASRKDDGFGVYVGDCSAGTTTFAEKSDPVTCSRALFTCESVGIVGTGVIHASICPSHPSPHASAKASKLLLASEICT